MLTLSIAKFQLVYRERMENRRFGSVFSDPNYTIIGTAKYAFAIYLVISQIFTR